MSKIIEVNIPGFGKRYCSDDAEYKLYDNLYAFYKKGTNIYHNEYGPAAESKNGSYEYWINNKYHRLNDFAYYKLQYKSYDVIGKELGYTKEDFIENLANTLIPINKDWL